MSHPILSHLIRSLNYPNDWTIEESVAQTWANPADILSLLLLVGGDVIQRAIAQQAGHGFWPTPVVFSFGWVAYAFSALLSIIGDNLLMPVTPDCPIIVINTSSGQSRENHSWILGRTVRDYDYWQPDEVKVALATMLANANRNKEGKTRAGLCVSIFNASARADRTAGVATKDLYFWSGYVVAFIQIGVAAVSWGYLGDWITFLVVVVGTILAFTSSSLRQWRHERWACRRKREKDCALTHGSGSQHVIVVRGQGVGLDLEDLAGWPETSTASLLGKLANGVLLLCWIVLLLTVTGIQNNTWVLLAVGGLGMLHTVIVAGAPRNPSAFGIHLEFEEVIVDSKVVIALGMTEKRYPGMGSALVPFFFPGDPRPDEDGRWWYEDQVAKKEKVTRLLEKMAIVKEQEEKKPYSPLAPSEMLDPPLAGESV